MIEMIHARTGNSMWVADDRVEEYKAAGHSLAAVKDPEKPVEKPKRARGKKDGLRDSK